MRKLTDTELSALLALRKHGSYCPGEDFTPSSSKKLFVSIMNSLVKKKQVRIETTDDGVRYHPVYRRGLDYVRGIAMMGTATAALVPYRLAMPGLSSIWKRSSTAVRTGRPICG